MTENDGYRHTERIAYLAGFPGSRREKDLVAVEVEGTVQSDLADDINRLLGAVRPATGATWAVNSASPLDVSAATVPVEPQSTVTVTQSSAVDVSDRAGRALGAVSPATGAVFPVEPQSTVTVDQANAVDISDRAGRSLGTVSTPDQPGYDSVEINETVSADGSVTATVSASGATELVGTVLSAGQYDVSIDWELSDGTTLRTVSVASGTAGGTATPLDEVAGAEQATVTITDQSSAQQTVTGSVVLA